MNSQSENSKQQNSAMDMLRKKNTRTLSELEQIPYQPQVYAIPIEQRKRESKLLADAVEFQPKLYQLIERLLAGFTKEFFGKEEVAEWIDELNATEITHNFTLEPGVWMAPVVLENKNGSAILGRRIHFDRMLNFYVTDLFEGLAAGHYSWQCGICHRFFFMETAHKQLYCSTVNPEYGVPCAYVAKNKLNMPKQKKKDGFGYATWKKRYDSLRNEKHKTNKNLPSAKYDVDVCDKAIELAKRHYEEAQIDFDYAQNQYEQDMVLRNLINEAKAALGKK